MLFLVYQTANQISLVVSPCTGHFYQSLVVSGGRLYFVHKSCMNFRRWSFVLAVI